MVACIETRANQSNPEPIAAETAYFGMDTVKRTGTGKFSMKTNRTSYIDLCTSGISARFQRTAQSITYVTSVTASNRHTWKYAPVVRTRFGLVSEDWNAEMDIPQASTDAEPQMVIPTASCVTELRKENTPLKANDWMGG